MDQQQQSQQQNPNNAAQAQAQDQKITAQEVLDAQPDAGQQQKATFELDDKFASLAKKEREFFLKEKRLKELEEKIKRYQELEALKERDPLDFLREAGVDLEKVLTRYAEVGGKSVDEKVVELEKRYQELERIIKEKEAEARRLQEQTAVENFKANLVKEIQSNTERWELTNNQEAYDLVFDVIERHFQVTKEQTGEGEVLPIEKAADMVERYLEERLKKAINAKKLQSLLPKQEPKAPSVGPTLSNSMAGNIQQATGSSALLPRDQALKEIAKRFKPQ
ncbi:MAG: hypothetical protein QXP01_03745 [Candidatus Hadarchaeum sp.]